jgi:serine/threonine protein kinase/Tol biopolymer transport system component
MLLTTGTQLGSYEILGPIGAGGMGEVYKARDTKLGREVAVKVLPEAFAVDKGRLARFEREARLLASLNHPNIATIHGLEEFDGVHFLVLELVPGETLKERISKAAVPLDEALALFKQVAAALEAAHEKGIIHRDLKPANIKITPESKVKVLDFGLAKALSEEAPSHDLSSSPTLSRQATAAGIILGTAAYMSPEQARGKTVDERTDIWAFGCCLYEALTGRRAFVGDTVTDVLAAVVKSEPDWSALPESMPWKIGELVGRCLRKDPGRRLHDIADARIEIDDAILEPSAALPPARPPAKGAGRRAVARLALIATVTAVLGVIVGRISTRSPPPRERPITRFTFSLPDGQELGESSLPFALSPDGRRLVYVAKIGGTQQLYLRELEELEAEAVPGTEGASNPFFSPDGRWIGFYGNGNLNKVSVSGGAVVTLCRAPPVYFTGWGGGSSWGLDDTIIFSEDIRGLLRVSAQGGTPERLTTPVTWSHIWPQMLPDGKSILYTVAFGGSSRLALLSLETGESRELLEGSTYIYQAQILPTGHLVYAQSGGLWAVPLDLSRLELTGSPVSVLGGVHEVTRAVIGPIAYFAAADKGSLAYVPGRATGGTSLAWVDREGREIAWKEEETLQNPRLSPDGSRVAMTLASREGRDIWVYEIDRGARTRLTFGGMNTEPIWSPDAARIAFASGTDLDLKSVPADGSASAEVLLQKKENQLPTSWSPDGRTLAFYEINPDTARDVWTTTLDGQGEPTPVLVTEFNEHSPMFSPDGRWLAYVSDESGREEIYLRPFSGPGAKHPVSTEGGREPVWSADGSELFYRSGDKVMAVAVETEPDLTTGTPRVLFEGPYVMYLGGGNNYDVSPDGRRFLMIRRELGPAPRQINVVLNWAEELKRLVPTN